MEQLIKISDAIPELPASFEKRVEDTLNAVCTQRHSDTLHATGGRPIRFRKKAWIAIAVAATLLLTTTAVAAAAILHREYSPETYMMQPQDVRDPIPDVEQAIASAKPETGDCSIVMLPEMEEAEQLNGWREAKGQPIYSEEDWGWIREIRPEVQEVLLDGSTLVFNIRLNTDHGLCFSWDPSQPQMVDALCDDAYFVAENGRVGQMLGLGTGINPAYVTADGATLYTECDLNDLREPFPTDGIMRITAEIGIRDARVSDMGFAGLLAKIRYTFTFDASAGADVAEPVVTERALFGSFTLSCYENGVCRNKPVSLDGVVLEETVHYRSTGIYVTYRVKSVPDGWTDRDTDALMRPNKGQWIGLSIACAPTGGDAGEALSPGYPNSIADGEYICILPIFPSDYARVKAAGYELRLGLRCVDTFNGEPVGDDWQMPEDPKNENREVGIREQPIASFPLQLP